MNPMPICEPESIEELSSPDKGLEIVMEARPAAAPAKRRRRYPWVLASLLPVVAAVVWLAPGILPHGGAVSAGTIRLQPLIFDFQAAQRQDHLLLTWNPKSQAVRDATGATLSIHDGPESEDVELSLDTLRRGGIEYYPIFEEASFRLALTHAPGGSVSQEAHASFRP